MIDNLALGLSHGLMMLAAILLIRRPDLDRERSPHDAPYAKSGAYKMPESGKIAAPETKPRPSA